MTELVSDARWRWTAGLGVAATALAALVMHLSANRVVHCRHWLGSTQGGSVAEAAALQCLADASVTHKIALFAVLLSA